MVGHVKLLDSTDEKGKYFQEVLITYQEKVIRIFRIFGELNIIPTCFPNLQKAYLLKIKNPLFICR